MISVTAAVLIHKGRILIARRPRGDRLAGYWEFPGGKLEKGETPQACLRRELYEEFGIRTRIGPFIDQNEYHYDHIAVRLLFFRAMALETLLLEDGPEHVGVHARAFRSGGARLRVRIDYCTVH